MSEALIDTTQADPRAVSAQAAGDADAGPHGKHRGPASSDDSTSPTHGKHRRPGETG